MTNVYLITNVVNNHKYVGVTDLHIEQRFKHHIAESKKSGKKRVLQRAIIAHGIENFKIEILEIFHERSEALEREKFWICLLKNQGVVLYNATEGGEDGKLSESTRQLISQRTKDAMKSPQVKARIRASRLGKKRGPMSDETKKKISKANKGRKLTEEVIQKMKAKVGSLSPNFGKKFTNEHRQRQSDAAKRKFEKMTDEERKLRRDRIKEKMNSPEMKEKVSQATKAALALRSQS